MFDGSSTRHAEHAEGTVALRKYEVSMEALMLSAGMYTPNSHAHSLLTSFHRRRNSSEPKSGHLGGGFRGRAKESESESASERERESESESESEGEGDDLQ